MTEMAEEEPVVIYRSVNREGETFALKPSSRKRLRDHFGNAIRVGSRVFIARDTHADYQEIHGEIAPQIIQLLTGVSRERLESLGGVVFRDPVTEDDIVAA